MRTATTAEQVKARTVIVGDVHGCRAELEALLDRIGFGSGDQLVFVGDLVARGPDSLGVLDVARRTGAIIVRGNHEQKLLDWRRAQRTGEELALGRTHLDVARAMRDVDWTLLETSPLWYDLPEHGARVVHAGVLPGVPMEEQSPHTLMHIRTCGVRGDVLGKKKVQAHGIPWASLYAGPPQVVFGHNALAGLQVHPWATGLDTGCVYGGRLTAIVLGKGERIPRSMARRRQMLVSQAARRVYFEPAKKWRAA
ncbi:MAG TPA: metallophosphoesterase [Polyangiaceae bacterium]|nr:metallophosphoesterase [Polyangiaceae bacterium]